MKARRLVVLGTLASNPYAGMAWMHMQIAAGLRRLGHDVYYIEATSCWPYDPVRRMKVNDSDYAVPYLKRVAESFGMADRWGFRRSYADKEWLGLSRGRAEELLAHADAVLNIAGSTRARTKEGLTVGRLVYYGTDPVYHEIGFAKGDPIARRTVDQHDDFVTYGENIGNADCPIPPLPRLRGQDAPADAARSLGGRAAHESRVHDRVQLEASGTRRRISGRGVLLEQAPRVFEVYRPAPPDEPADRVGDGLGGCDRYAPRLRRDGPRHWNDRRRALPARRQRLALDRRPRLHDRPLGLPGLRPRLARRVHGCQGPERAPASGWFSERDACYLAAGRPVIAQDTGFGCVLPTGEGLFAFNSMDDILAAFDAVQTDYERQSQAARAIAEDYFKAETVLAKVLEDLGL